MKRLLVFAMLLTAVSAVVWSLRQPTLDGLRVDASKARSEKAELEALNKMVAAAPVETVDPQELNRLRALRLELARLRGSIGELRQSASQKPDQLQAKAETVKEEASLIRARREAKTRSEAAGMSIHICRRLVIGAVILTDGTVSQNWNEVRHRILEEGNRLHDRYLYYRDLFVSANGPQGFLGEFEIIPTRPDIHIQLKPGVVWPEIPLIREIQPRPQSDGGFARYYSWLGRPEEITLPDANFGAWEAKNFVPSTETALAR